MNPILCFCQEFYIHVLAREYNNQDLKMFTKAHLIHVMCCQIKYILTYSCTFVSWSRCSVSFENESFELFSFHQEIYTKLKVTPALTRVLIKILLQWIQPPLLFISIIYFVSLSCKHPKLTTETDVDVILYSPSLSGCMRMVQHMFKALERVTGWPLRAHNRSRWLDWGLAKSAARPLEEAECLNRNNETARSDAILQRSHLHCQILLNTP